MLITINVVLDENHNFYTIQELTTCNIKHILCKKCFLEPSPESELQFGSKISPEI